MTCRCALIALLLALAPGGLGSLQAASFGLTDGTTLDGDPISFDVRGVVVKKPDGTFADRVAWTNFTQEALKQFNKLPRAKTFVEPYVEVEETDADKKPAIEIKPKLLPRLERPAPRAGMGALFSSPITMLLFFLVWAGNIYAGFEIGIFRNYQPWLVAGVAAVAPVLGPVIFLCLPPRVIKTHDELAAEAMAHHQAEAEHLAQVLALPGRPGEADGAGEVAALEGARPRVTVYQRGQTTFNRRFFETKFSGFLKMVPGDAEKDMVILIRSARGEHTGNRLTRILQNELHLLVTKGGATSDVIIPFTEIYEVQVKPKEA